MGSIDDIADRYVEQWAPLDPIGATFVGVAGHDDTLTDLSPDSDDPRFEPIVIRDNGDGSFRIVAELLAVL